MNGELYLPPIIQPKSEHGKFPKGHVPFNKGKKWDEYMSPESQAKARANLVHKGAIGDTNRSKRKRVVGITDNAETMFFDCASLAAEAVKGAHERNIRYCCLPNSTRMKAGGIRWFYADDLRWHEYYEKKLNEKDIWKRRK